MKTTIETIENTDESLFAYLDKIDATKKMLSEVLGEKFQWSVTEKEINLLSKSLEENIDKYEDCISTYKAKIEYLQGRRIIDKKKQNKINRVRENLPFISKIQKIIDDDKSFEKRIGKIMRELAEIDPKKNINVFSLSTVSSKYTRDLREYAEKNLKWRRGVNWQKTLASIIWMNDKKAWELREKYFTTEAYYKEDEDSEWIVDMLEMYLDSLQGIDTHQAWEIREKYFNYDCAKPRYRSRGDSKLYKSTVARYDDDFEIPWLIRSLATIDTSRAW